MGRVRFQSIVFVFWICKSQFVSVCLFQHTAATSLTVPKCDDVCMTPVCLVLGVWGGGGGGGVLPLLRPSGNPCELGFICLYMTQELLLSLEAPATETYSRNSWGCALCAGNAASKTQR